MTLDNIFLNGNFEYSNIISCLESDNEDLKPYALLELQEIKSQEDFDIIVSNLTGHDGRIRELVSSKICEIHCGNFAHLHFSLFLDALCDVNPNVSRNIVKFISSNELPLNDFLIDRIFIIMQDIEANSKPKKWRTQKNHLLNKMYFKLYWCLEALAENFEQSFNKDKLLEILAENSECVDYTIREKVAKILCKMKNPPPDLYQKMKNDVNYYVKLNFYDKI
ncbi:hypothetical protein IJC60_01075 [bacterium]|nr:hypothetical protein [bacterium]